MPLSWYREKIETAGIQFYPLRPDELSTNKPRTCDSLQRRHERVAFRQLAYDAI
jgi:hypothetical protein